jgi:hypothetical protein
MAEQQINLTDLEPSQLQEVKKQLDQVSSTLIWLWMMAWL